MSDVLKDAVESAAPVVNALTEKLIKYLEAGEALVSEQVPLFVGDIIRWGIAHNLIIAAKSFIVFVVCAFFVVKGMGWLVRGFELDDGSYDNDAAPYFIRGFPSVILGSLLGLTSISPFFDAITTATQAYVAPRVYLLEYLNKLIQ